MKIEPYVGYWVLPCGTVRIGTVKAPNWFHIKMTKLLLGWKWINE